MANSTSAAEFIRGEFIDCTERFIERGQGWSGHLLTYGTALLDLHKRSRRSLSALHGAAATSRKPDGAGLSFSRRPPPRPGQRETH